MMTHSNFDLQQVFVSARKHLERTGASALYHRVHTMTTGNTPFPWGWGIIGLLGLLLLQVGLFKTSAVVQSPTLRPALETLCARAHCQLPALHHVAAIHIIDRGLHTAYDGSGALEFHATLVNEFDLPQAFPNIRLSLNELDGSLLAQRVFSRKDYLPGSSAAAQMPAKLPVEIKLSIAKPLAEVGGFTLDLL